jgi:hypothetical protein
VLSNKCIYEENTLNKKFKSQTIIIPDAGVSTSGFFSTPSPTASELSHIRLIGLMYATKDKQQTGS